MGRLGRAALTHERGCEVAWWGGALVVSGEIDIATCDVVRAAIAEHIVDGRIVLDLSGVAFCDSSCVHRLVEPTRFGVTVVVRRPSAAVRKVLAIVHAEELLTIED